MDCSPLDFNCHVNGAVVNLLLNLANMLSSLSWLMVRSAFTGNAGTIEDNEWSISTAMTSRWGLLLLVVVFALVLVQMIMSAASGNIRQAINAFFSGILAWPTTLVAVWLTVVLTGATDRLTMGVLSSGQGPSEDIFNRFMTNLETFSLNEIHENVSKAFMIVLMLAISTIASIVLSLMLSFRNFALICLVGFSPLAFMAMPMVPIRGWITKWAQAVMALIMAKPIAAGMLVLSVDLGANSDGIYQWLTAVVAMGMAAFAPVITLRLFAFMGAETASAYGGQGQAVMNNAGAGVARGGRAVVSVVR